MPDGDAGVSADDLCVETPTLCKLDGASCPGPACPFWVLGECLLSDVEIADADVAEWLLRLRAELEQ